MAELIPLAQQRVSTLHDLGRNDAYLYGVPGDGYTEELGGLNAFFLLVDRPEVYNLPTKPRMPSRNLLPSSILSAAGAAALAFLGMLGFRQRRMEQLHNGEME